MIIPRTFIFNWLWRKFPKCLDQDCNVHEILSCQKWKTIVAIINEREQRELIAPNSAYTI